MFQQIANVAQIMRQAQALQGRLQQLKEGLAEIRVTGIAGNGLVEVDASGDQRILAVRIGERAQAGFDLGQLGSMIAAATNDALDRAKVAAAEAMQSAAGDIPGLSQVMSQLGSASSSCG